MQVVYYYADWCGPCSQVKPILSDVETEYGIEIERVDLDENRRRARDDNISSIPTVLVKSETGDTEYTRVVGVSSKHSYTEAIEAVM